jgi:ABC-type molybdate transport system substrate-binding protein
VVNDDEEIGDGPIRVVGPTELEEVLEEMAALYEEEGRGTAEIRTTDDVPAAVAGADIAITAGEADMETIARDGHVDDGAWNQITTKEGVEYFVAELSDAPNAEGANEWVSFASGAAPWQIFEVHGFDSPLSE